MEATVKGFRVRSTTIGYSVYYGDVCVAGGGVCFVPDGERANLAEGRRAVRDIIAGKRKPLSPIPVKPANL